MEFPEGKLSIKLLKKLIDFKGAKNEGIIIDAGIGEDATVIDIEKAKNNACRYYGLSEDTKCHLILKSDPITFPTAEPGKYAVIVNSNDVVTQGAIPFGFLASIIVSSSTMWEQLYQIQQQIDSICKDKEISILGGHTEKSESARTPIIAGMMFGFVPVQYLPDRKLSNGDKIVQIGWTAAEGTSILFSTDNKDFLSKFSDEELQQAQEISTTLDIAEIALNINKKYRPHIIHDCTEGGVLGAIYEMFDHLDVGINIQHNFPVHPVTERICSLLNIDPLRLISSGAFLCVMSPAATSKLLNDGNIQTPVRVIGEVDTLNQQLLLNNQKLEEPGPDEVIKGLKNIEQY